MIETDSFEYPWLPADDVAPVQCCICGGKNPTRAVHAVRVNEQTFEILYCEADDLLFLSPQPGAKYAEALYNHPSYFAETNDAYGHAVTAESGRKTGGFRVDELAERGMAPKTLLEIGCGLGYTLEAFAASGVSVKGVEFSEESAAACREKGLTVEVATLSAPVPAAIAEQGPYDAIALYSVLEHLPDPVAFLAHLGPLLSPDGVLIVRVPRMSEKGPWISLLDHFWHFTSASLQRVLALQGFTVYDSYPSGTFVDTKGGTLESMTVLAKHSL